MSPLTTVICCTIVLQIAWPGLLSQKDGNGKFHRQNLKQGEAQYANPKLNVVDFLGMENMNYLVI